MCKYLYISTINVFFEGFLQLTDRKTKKTQVTGKTSHHSSRFLGRLLGKKVHSTFSIDDNMNKLNLT